MVVMPAERGTRMEADVFAYFVAIGAGLSLGLSLGFLPAVVVYKYLRRDRHAGKAAQARTRA